MFRNVFLKKILKTNFFPIFSLLNKFVPKSDKEILIYSANKGIGHSLIPLRQYLQNQGFGQKYRIICGIESLKYKDEGPWEFVSKTKVIWTFLRSKHVFYSAGQIPIKPSNPQIVIHLQHGNSNFKTMGLNTKINNGQEFYFTYMIASSDVFVPIMVKEYACKEENIKVLGDPMVDQLLTSPHNLYDFKAFNKVLLWMPTFRQSDYLGYDDSLMENLLPLFSENDYPFLNEQLKKRNIKLIVKIHPAQKNLGNKRRHFSHLDIYTNDEFQKAGYSLFPMMAQVDGLVGDYSSASMQYLLTDKPQAYVVPDIDEYGEKRGFNFPDIENYMGGHIIKRKIEFWNFLDDFIAGKDVYAEKRRRLSKLIYKYHDADSCKRIVELSKLYVD